MAFIVKQTDNKENVGGLANSPGHSNSAIKTKTDLHHHLRSFNNDLYSVATPLMRDVSE